MEHFEVIFYETENGEKPVQDFLDNSDIKMPLLRSRRKRLKVK